ncbi:hypothetical protein SteCoe_32197 [Stentor coeruleus]|uniref:Uncharacterized protein n=1 Tax=Stentor coeruleus TaxID=5963 RepID=A0A1R2AZK7_9CILI|nr:hypothetical protein SteCoe_32197 [Stentor coeruleus]
MRKTILWNSKEHTPEFYNPKVTYDGRTSIIRSVNKTSSVSKARRFPQYEKDEKRLGNEVGPGTYLQFHKCIYASRPKGTPIYKRFYRQRDLSDNWYYYINDSHHQTKLFKSTF